MQQILLSDLTKVKNQWVRRYLEINKHQGIDREYFENIFDMCYTNMNIDISSLKIPKLIRTIKLNEEDAIFNNVYRNELKNMLSSLFPNLCIKNVDNISNYLYYKN